MALFPRQTLAPQLPTRRLQRQRFFIKLPYPRTLEISPLRQTSTTKGPNLCWRLWPSSMARSLLFMRISATI
ncbi:hypothetical protein I307_03697 [Cryptococcus deuterogattii 99/473]|uniref:Uncharacterized protein n=1 Tax=Cryptococcus deuterogattii Ram5 TaxID=1296110 RepID=A0A0D0U4V0_9TREE|nr:hypothetical protein I309_00724 [Cryptococcus deuterogattii LA55]KIR36752.1 hypothetical protein I352_00063 [Cryptococcus deuterogattii MMRL2647]KIR43223.1 hypothetical protein I313_00064 [Cryptococcus deuterogattii Ram5]KIR92517.1 hypothetical protein I304_03922 [Cryptococcus deuterogattii CBS 10090]KIS01683.1 hypothetical protein L804_01562 [Cryptococcus deuterogattii 2001/935-1]KIY56959.1 hypothetical protein I307_03697 [Cryptococcus deuterogattii 99/473]